MFPRTGGPWKRTSRLRSKGERVEGKDSFPEHGRKEGKKLFLYQKDRKTVTSAKLTKGGKEEKCSNFYVATSQKKGGGGTLPGGCGGGEPLVVDGHAGGVRVSWGAGQKRKGSHPYLLTGVRGKRTCVPRILRPASKPEVGQVIGEGGKRKNQGGGKPHARCLI